METIGQRLKRLRQAKGLSQAGLAAMAGVSQGTIGNLEGGTRGYGESIVDIANALNTSPAYLRLDVDSEEAAASSWPPLSDDSEDMPVEKHEGFAIRQLDTGGRMGTSGLVLRDQPGVIKAWHVSHEWMRQNVHRITSPANLAIVTGFGDSMRPLYNPGDPLLVDTGRKRVDVDGIYFFRVGEEGFIKRLQRIPTAQGTVIRAKSENPAYDPFEITGGMDFEVFGWVVKAWRGEEF